MPLRSCTSFLIEKPADIKATLGKVRTFILSKGGHFSGDDNKGTFAGKSPVGLIEGSYQVNDYGIGIEITNKPLLVPCNSIEAEVRKYFL